MTYHPCSTLYWDRLQFFEANTVATTMDLEESHRRSHNKTAKSKRQNRGLPVMSYQQPNPARSDSGQYRLEPVLNMEILTGQLHKHWGSQM